jgi:PAS domain S-box-containing protein
MDPSDTRGNASQVLDRPTDSVGEWLLSLVSGVVDALGFSHPSTSLEVGKAELDSSKPATESFRLDFYITDVLFVVVLPLLLHLLLRAQVNAISRWLLGMIWMLPFYALLLRLRLHRFRKQMTADGELFRLISENAADMIALVDVTGKRLYNSPAYSKLLGYSREELRTTSSFQQIHPDDRQKVMAAAEDARRTGLGKKVEYRIRHKDGHWLVVESTANTVRNAQGAVEMLVIVNRDISERKRAEEQLKHNALHDALTNLPNRKLFHDRLRRSWARSQTQDGYRFAVLFVDIDGFKVFNDTMGHTAGDDLIAQISARLSGCIRFEDFISRSTARIEGNPERGEQLLARMGGDEFTILVGNIKGPEDAMRVANRVHKALGPFAVQGKEVFVTASIGIALSSTPHACAEEMLRNADIAMYRAKILGKSRTEFFDPEMYSSTVRRLGLEADLRKAIDAHEFMVHYQPIVDLESGRVSGFEALVRWHSEHGLRYPDYFIGTVEETGLVVPLGEWILREACRQLRTWHLQHPEHSLLSVTVNISTKQLSDANLVPHISAVLQETGVEAGLLHLEITESVAMSSPEEAQNVLKRLKQIGVILCLDDFGTGHSSLARLQRLPVDVLKIDRSFVMHMHTDADGLKLVHFIVGVAHTLGMKVVAEGIENATQLAYLRNLGCDFGQGYFFARPSDPEVAEKLLATGVGTLEDAPFGLLSRAAGQGLG